MSAVMFGNGISGFGSNILRAATLLIWPDHKYTAVLVCYIFSFIVLAGCAAAQVCLRKNDFATHFLKQTAHRDSNGKTAEEVL